MSRCVKLAQVGSSVLKCAQVCSSSIISRQVSSRGFKSGHVLLMSPVDQHRCPLFSRFPLNLPSINSDSLPHDPSLCHHSLNVDIDVVSPLSQMSDWYDTGTISFLLFDSYRFITSTFIISVGIPEVGQAHTRPNTYESIIMHHP